MTKVLPIAKATVGQEVDAVLAGLHARITVLESAAESTEKKVMAFIKATWPHVVTWASTALVGLKLFGKL